MFNGGMGNMQGMMKKVQKLQADMAKAGRIKAAYNRNYSRRRCCHRSCQR